jgi:hypothetical protein
MEGIEQNPVVYDLMSEMAFRHNKIDVKVILSFFQLTEYCLFCQSMISIYNWKVKSRAGYG